MYNLFIRVYQFWQWLSQRKSVKTFLKNHLAHRGISGVTVGIIATFQKKFKTMAKKNIATEIQEMVAAGDATVVADNKFSGADGAPLKVRNMESTNDPLEVGDEITIPTDYKVIAVKIGEGSYPCTVAEVKSADGSERNMRFFPNSLAKNITPIDAEGRRMPKVKTTGAVASWYSQKDTVDEAMKELAGKTLVVAAKTVYSVRDYNTKEIRQTGIYQYEWKA